jgi:hypothetical protein
LIGRLTLKKEIFAIAEKAEKPEKEENIEQ